MAKKPAAKKSSKAPAKKTARKSAPTEMLLVGSKTKEALKATGCNVAGDALDGLNAIVHFYVAQASARAAANGRKTVRAHDFMLP
jgi:histone H3/H4